MYRNLQNQQTKEDDYENNGNNIIDNTSGFSSFIDKTRENLFNVYFTLL